MSKNTTVIGRVGTKPEVSTSPSGKALAKFRLAETIWNKDTRSEDTRWYDVSAWERDAKAVGAHVNVGMRVYVTGTPSVYSGTSGDRDQINAREVGAADRFIAPSDEGEEW